MSENLETLVRTSREARNFFRSVERAGERLLDAFDRLPAGSPLRRDLDALCDGRLRPMVEDLAAAWTGTRLIERPEPQPS